MALGSEPAFILSGNYRQRRPPQLSGEQWHTYADNFTSCTLSTAIILERKHQKQAAWPRLRGMHAYTDSYAMCSAKQPCCVMAMSATDCVDAATRAHCLLCLLEAPDSILLKDTACKVGHACRGTVARNENQSTHGPRSWLKRNGQVTGKPLMQSRLV